MVLGEAAPSSGEEKRVEAERMPVGAGGAPVMAGVAAAVRGGGAGESGAGAGESGAGAGASGRGDPYEEGALLRGEGAPVRAERAPVRADRTPRVAEVTIALTGCRRCGWRRSRSSAGHSTIMASHGAVGPIQAPMAASSIETAAPRPDPGRARPRGAGHRGHRRQQARPRSCTMFTI